MGFSFAAGNTAKLVRLPLYAVARCATALIPRTRDEWVFGCAVGVADGARALYERARRDGHDIVWLTADERQAREARVLGVAHLPKGSLRAFWRTARARVVVVTHGFGDVNRYAVAGAFVVQLWHGIPLKRIGLDSPETTRSALLPGLSVVTRALAVFYAATMRQIDVLPAASHLVRGRLESAFGLSDDAVVVTGEPRVDVLSAGAADERRARGRAVLGAGAGPLPAESARTILYAPTWRDGDPDPAVPSARQWRVLGEILDRHDAVLYVRSHPLGDGDYAPPSETTRVRLLGSDGTPDVTPALPAIDVLVTDYSSLAYDVGLVGMPVVYLAPDVEAYSARRGFYGRFEDVAGSGYARDWDEACAQLDAVLGDAEEYRARAERSRRLSDGVHAFRDGLNTERVYRAIMDRLRRRRAPERRTRD